MRNWVGRGTSHVLHCAVSFMFSCHKQKNRQISHMHSHGIFFSQAAFVDVTFMIFFVCDSNVRFLTNGTQYYSWNIAAKLDYKTCQRIILQRLFFQSLFSTFNVLISRSFIRSLCVGRFDVSVRSKIAAYANSKKEYRKNSLSTLSPDLLATMRKRFRRVFDAQGYSMQ